jgi:hypothetical protein
LVAVGTAFVVGTSRLLVALRRPFLSGGDVAIMELSVRRAVSGMETLGPYSRFGWHHPGPALFYLFAPFYVLSGDRGRSLFVAAWLINGVCVLGTILLVRVRLGERAARVLAVIVGLLLVATGFSDLISPWNPSLLCLPLLLLLFVSADAASGSSRSLALAAVVGSYLIQTHLGIAPVVGVFLAIAAVGWFRPQVGRARTNRGALLRLVWPCSL